MASLSVTSIQAGIHQAQQHVDGDLPRADEKSNFPAIYDKDASSKIDVYSIPSFSRDLDPGTATPDREWKAGKEEWMIISVISFVGLMVALDATILVPALPVGAFDMNKSSREI